MADPKYFSDVPREHDDNDFRAKRVKTGGFDYDNTTYRNFAVDSGGRMKSADILQEYQMSDQDTGEPSYFGFLRDDGAWYIVKQTTSGTSVTWRYVKGASSYNFSNRGSESYNTFDVEF